MSLRMRPRRGKKARALGSLLLRGLSRARTSPKRRVVRVKKADQPSKKTRTRPSLPAPVVQPIPVAAPAWASQRLQTIDLISPESELRRSIEGFLMDQRSVHTQRAYGKDLKRFVKFLVARKAAAGPERLDRTMVIAYKDSLLAEKLEHTTIDRHLATLRSFFKWLVDDGIIEKSPAEAVRFMNPKRVSKTQGFSDEEVQKILALPDLHTRTGAMHYTVLMILFFCGLRRSELCELRTSNIGMEREHAVLRLRGKGNRERLIVLVPPVWKAIQYYLRITRKDLTQDTFLFTPIRNNRTKEFDKAIDSSMIFYIVRKYARAAGVANRVSPHSCRATAISNARDHQVPDRAIQDFAGWATTDMITRYDKRRTSVEKSAAHSIRYGEGERDLPAYIDESARKTP